MVVYLSKYKEWCPARGIHPAKMKLNVLLCNSSRHWIGGAAECHTQDVSSVLTENTVLFY